MLKRFVTVPVLCAGLLTSACATEPMSQSHSHVTADKRHWGVQIAMHTGVPNTPIQTVMVVYNKYSKSPIAVVNGQTKPLGEKLFDDMLSLVGNVGAAGITGKYILKASQAECPPTALCGTLVQVNNSAGANADSTSSASQQGTTTTTGGSS